jgi:hypothetical protein
MLLVVLQVLNLVINACFGSFWLHMALSSGGSSRAMFGLVSGMCAGVAAIQIYGLGLSVRSWLCVRGK